MSNFGHGGFGFSLKALLEDPNLQNPPKLHTGVSNLKKPGKHGGHLMPNHNSAFLGPNLWERPGNNGSDFDLEYMDLDEFLSENGIPVDLEENDEAQTMSLLATALTQSPRRSPNAQCSPGIPLSPPSPRQTNLLQQERDKTMSGLNVYMPDSPIIQNVSPINLSPLPTPSPLTPEPSAIEKCLLDDNFGIKFPLPDTDTESLTGHDANTQTTKGIRKAGKRKLDEELSFTADDLPMVTIPVYSRNHPDMRVTNFSGPPSVTWSESSNDNESVDGDGNLIQSSIPGQENFDPTSRKFSEEELKPQPIIKKSRKIFVDDSAKDDRYWQRRKKNNIAAKRSRDARRVKENQIAMRASYLEQQNDGLREQYEEIKRENEELIKRLSKYEKV